MCQRIFGGPNWCKHVLKHCTITTLVPSLHVFWLHREEHSMDQCQSRLKLSENFERHWSIQISGEMHMDQSLVHTFSWGNSYGPMVLKVLLRFSLHWYWSMDGSSQLQRVYTSERCPACWHNIHMNRNRSLLMCKLSTLPSSKLSPILAWDLTWCTLCWAQADKKYHLTENYYIINSETIMDVKIYIPFSIINSQVIDVM